MLIHTFPRDYPLYYLFIVSWRIKISFVSCHVLSLTHHVRPRDIASAQLNPRGRGLGVRGTRHQAPGEEEAAGDERAASGDPSEADAK